jgi:hypothetical protein
MGHRADVPRESNGSSGGRVEGESTSASGGEVSTRRAGDQSHCAKETYIGILIAGRTAAHPPTSRKVGASPVTWGK